MDLSSLVSLGKVTGLRGIAIGVVLLVRPTVNRVSITGTATRTRLRLANAVALFALSSCASYVPPPPAAPEEFSREMNASYDRTWSAITYVAGASFFKIKAFEKASGLMTLDFALKNVLPYVNCGTAENSTTHQSTPALGALGLAGVDLEGTANINIRSEGPRRTAVQFNSHYVLSGYRPTGYGALAKVVEWNFNSGSSDTQNLGIAVTCQPSYKIEHDFLTEVAARL
jgi:hypothetical protein